MNIVMFPGLIGRVPAENFTSKFHKVIIHSLEKLDSHVAVRKKNLTLRWNNIKSTFLRM